MYVVDLRHWLDEQGQLAPQVKLAPFIASIVESATAATGSGLTVTPCRRSSSRARCAGYIATWLREDVVEWACNACSEAGVITGWQGTHWDLREADDTDGPTDVVVFVPLDELPSLRTLPMPASARSIMATLPTVASGIAAVPFTHAEADRLCRLMQLHLHEAKGARKARLERSIGRVEQALMFAEQVKANAQRRKHGDQVH